MAKERKKELLNEGTSSTGAKYCYKREYSSWRSMKNRCYNPNHVAYKNYGGRGISICDRWLNSFYNFLSDMGPAPEGYSIERVDNGDSYSKDNCKWASPTEQARNRRNNFNITFRGETKTISEWSTITGLSRVTIRYRLRLGWSTERALLELPSRVLKVRFFRFGGEELPLSVIAKELKCKKKRLKYMSDTADSEEWFINKLEEMRNGTERHHD